MCKFGEEGKVAFYKFEVESDRGDCFVDRYGNTFISSDVIPSPIAKIQAELSKCGDGTEWICGYRRGLQWVLKELGDE